MRVVESHVLHMYMNHMYYTCIYMYAQVVKSCVVLTFKFRK